MFDLERLRGILKTFSSRHVIVVGDVFLDEYLIGDANRISPEAPVPVVNMRERHYALGGAGNVAENLMALGAECSLVSVVGTDPPGQKIQELTAELAGDEATLPVPGWTTGWKIRVVAGGQQIVRMDTEKLQSPEGSVFHQLVEMAELALPRAHALVFSDYGKGLLTPRLVYRLMEMARRFHVPVFVDPKRGLKWYEGARLIKPNAKEAQALTGTFSSLHYSGLQIQNRTSRAGQPDVAITLGAKGILTIDSNGQAVTVPTVRRELRDVQGAGDTAMAALTLAYCAGATQLEAAVIANAAAGVAVSKPRTATASRVETGRALPGVIQEWISLHGGE